MKARCDASAWTRAGLVALAVLAAGWAPARLEAFNPQPEPPGFGMIGMTGNQTARLNVVRFGPADPAHADCPVAGGERFTFSLFFFDTSGRMLAEKTVVLGPGEADALDLPGRLLGPAAVRAQVRPVLKAVEPPTPFCGVATVEVFDNRNLKTRVIYTGHP